MTPDPFFEAAIDAGAILTGFYATFLVFRIQREAEYYRSKGKQQFSASLLLLILGMSVTAVMCVGFPLLRLANPEFASVGALKSNIVVRGFIASGILAAGYFLIELIHYRIILYDPPLESTEDVGQVKKVDRIKISKRTLQSRWWKTQEKETLEKIEIPLHRQDRPETPSTPDPVQYVLIPGPPKRLVFQYDSNPYEWWTALFFIGWACRVISNSISLFGVSL
jgi:hypothetical protein